MTKKNENDIAEDFKGYSTFIEVENTMLRAYNQYSVLSNMREEGLTSLVEQYLAYLSKEDRLALLIIAEYIKHKGIEETRRELIREGVFAHG